LDFLDLTDLPDVICEIRKSAIMGCAKIGGGEAGAGVRGVEDGERGVVGVADVGEDILGEAPRAGLCKGVEDAPAIENEMSADVLSSEW
jgi:hypothetical protein